MDITAFKKKIKSDPAQPIYFLYGEESFYIDKLGEYVVEQTVNPEMKDFNFTVMYGKEVDSGPVLDSLMRYPMMAPYQVILLKEAHQMKNFADLLPYIEKPMETTIFIIEYKKRIDNDTKFLRHLAIRIWPLNLVLFVTIRLQNGSAIMSRIKDGPFRPTRRGFWRNILEQIYRRL